MSGHFGVEPTVPVPMVRVLDEQGREVLYGWYYRHVNRCPHCTEELKESDIDHIVMHDGFADWNMPRDIECTRITPPHRIEVIPEDEMDRYLR